MNKNLRKRETRSEKNSERAFLQRPCLPKLSILQLSFEASGMPVSFRQCETMVEWVTRGVTEGVEWELFRVFLNLDRRDDSWIESTGCSSWTPVCNSYHFSSSLQLSATPVSEDVMPCSHMHASKTLIHISKKRFFFLFLFFFTMSVVGKFCLWCWNLEWRTAACSCEITEWELGPECTSKECHSNWGNW